MWSKVLDCEIERSALYSHWIYLTDCGDLAQYPSERKIANRNVLSKHVTDMKILIESVDKTINTCCSFKMIFMIVATWYGIWRLFAISTNASQGCIRNCTWLLHFEKSLRRCNSHSAPDLFPTMGSLRHKVGCQIEKVQGAQEEFTSSETIRFKAG